MPTWFHGSNTLITKFTLNHSRTLIDLGPGVYFANNSTDSYPGRLFTFILTNYYDYPGTYYEIDNNDPEWFHDNDGSLVTEIPIDTRTGLRMIGTTWNYRQGNPKYLNNYEIDVLCSRIQLRRGTQLCFRTERAMKYLNMHTKLDTIYVHDSWTVIHSLRNLLKNPYLAYNSARFGTFDPPFSCYFPDQEKFDEIMDSEEVSEYITMYKQVCELMRAHIHEHPDIELWDPVALKFNN